MGRAHATKTTKNTNVTEPITAQQETALLEINRNKSQVAKSFLECDLAHAAQQSVADIAAAQKTHYSHQRLRFFDMRQKQKSAVKGLTFTGYAGKWYHRWWPSNSNLC